MNLNRNHFQIAFGMRGYIDGKIKHDSDQVIWEALVYEGDGCNEKVA